MSRLTEGDLVTIYYDPQDPASAVVEKSQAGIFVYLAAGVGIVFVWAGIKWSGLLAPSRKILRGAARTALKG